VPATDVITELARVFERGDWPAMGRLYHPQALLATVTGGGAALTAEEVIRQLELASDDFVFSVRGSQPAALDEHAAIVTGFMRRRMPTGGWGEARHVWLLTVRDDLIYRQGVYPDARSAAAAYERLGIELGMPAAPASA
jgi:ketosteroid isomerase-like protein